MSWWKRWVDMGARRAAIKAPALARPTWLSRRPDGVKEAKNRRGGHRPAAADVIGMCLVAHSPPVRGRHAAPGLPQLHAHLRYPLRGQSPRLGVMTQMTSRLLLAALFVTAANTGAFAQAGGQFRRQDDEFRSLVPGTGASAGGALRQAHARGREDLRRPSRGQIEHYEIPYLQQKNNDVRLDTDILHNDPVDRSGDERYPHPAPRTAALWRPRRPMARNNL